MADRRYSYTEVVEAISVTDKIIGAPELVNTIVKAVNEVKRLTDEAWNAESSYRTGDEGQGMSQHSKDVESAYQLGRAHAFCEVLGDQPHLFSVLRMLNLS